MKVNKSLIAIFASALALGSCTDFLNDFDAKRQKYSDNFTNVFGDIDPNQDWNFAQQVTTDVNLSNLPKNSVVKIYEVDPLANVGAKILSEMDLNSKTSWKFDAPKTDKELFVQVMNGNNRIYAGFCAVDNGLLKINASAFHKKQSLVTRANMGSGVGDLAFTQISWNVEPNNSSVMVKPYYNQQSLMSYKQIKLGQENGKWYIYYSDNVTTLPYRKLKYNNDDEDGYNLTATTWKYDDDETEAITSTSMSDFVEEAAGTLSFKSGVTYGHDFYISKCYKISADTKASENVKWLIGDCEDLFWLEDSPFRESQDYRNDNHLQLYEENGTSLEEVEKGVLFTTSKDDAEIDIPMMFGATQNQNILGYYYYTSEQDPREVNRYILYDDARPTENIKVDDVAIEDGMKMQQRDATWKDNSVVSCVFRHLMYFGSDGTEAGTTKFPKDVKIGFFIRRQGTYAYNTGETGWAYSDPKLNEKYFANEFGKTLAGDNGYSGSWGYRGSKSVSGINDDPTRGNVKAICWNYGGRVLVGFGDDSGDCDLNDFVFWVNGDIKEKPKIQIEVEDKDDVYEWMVACEDLGSTDDYDFNDVVFGVRHYTSKRNIYETHYEFENGEYKLHTTVPTVIDKKNYLVITPYAAGGTLKSDIYYGDNNLGEIHSLICLDQKSAFDAMETGSMPILNAAEGPLQYTGTPIVIELADYATFSMAANDMAGFKIKSHQLESEKAEGEAAEIIMAPGTGEAPQMMVLPTGWDWPIECNEIYNVYEDFKNWVADASNNWGWIENKKGSYATNPYKTASAGGNDDPESDWSEYGEQVPGDKIITDDKNNKYYSKDLFAQFEDATLTFEVKSIKANSTTYISIYKNNQWFDNFTQTPVLKKIDGETETTVESVTSAGIYKLELSAANLAELAQYSGLIFGNMNISKIVISGTAKSSGGGSASATFTAVLATEATNMGKSEYWGGQNDSYGTLLSIPTGVTISEGSSYLVTFEGNAANNTGLYSGDGTTATQIGVPSWNNSTSKMELTVTAETMQLLKNGKLYAANFNGLNSQTAITGTLTFTKIDE